MRPDIWLHFFFRSRAVQARGVGCAGGLGYFEIRRVWPRSGWLHGESPTGSLQGRVSPSQLSEDWEKHGNRGGRERRKAEVAWERPGLWSSRAAPATSLECFRSADPGCGVDVQGAGSKSAQSGGLRWTGWCRARVRVQMPFSFPSPAEPDISPLEKSPELKTLSLHSLGGHSLIAACNRPTTVPAAAAEIMGLMARKHPTSFRLSLLFWGFLHPSPGRCIFDFE